MSRGVHRGPTLARPHPGSEPPCPEGLPGLLPHGGAAGRHDGLAAQVRYCPKPRLQAGPAPPSPASSPPSRFPNLQARGWAGTTLFFPQHTPRERFWGAQGLGLQEVVGSPASTASQGPASFPCRCLLLKRQGGTLTTLTLTLTLPRWGQGTASLPPAGSAWAPPHQPPALSLKIPLPTKATVPCSTWLVCFGSQLTHHLFQEASTDCLGLP